MKRNISSLKKSIDKRKVSYPLYKILILGLLIIYVMYLNTLHPVPEYGQLTVVVIAFLGGIWLLLPARWDKAVLLACVFAYTAYVVAQDVYHWGFDSYFRFQQALSLYSEVLGVRTSAFELIRWRDYQAFLVFAGFSLLVVRFQPKNSLKRVVHAFYSLAVAIAVVGISLVCFIVLDQKLEAKATDALIYNESDQYVYDVIPSPKSFVKKFGINAFLIRDFEQGILMPLSRQHSLLEEQIRTYFETNSKSAGLNEQTGIFKGKSLIIIQGESLMNLGIDPILTPTLHRLQEGGMRFDNFSAPLLPGSTSDTEIMVQMSIYPVDDGPATMHRYAKNAYPASLPNLMKNMGYDTSVYHNNYGSYYNRTVFYNAQRYDHFYDSISMGRDDLMSDREMLDYASWIVAEKKDFFAYFIAYSGHQPYNYDSLKESGYSEETVREYAGYLDVIERTYPDLDEATKVYLAKCMSLDRGVESLLNTLEYNGKLDDVVVVLFGDHKIKGYAPNKHLESMTMLDVKELTVPLIIWSNQGTSSVIDKHCNSLDLMPTLLNMFGIAYDPQCMFGFDIFDPSYIGYYFDANGQLISKDFFFSYEDGLSFSGGLEAGEAYRWVEIFKQRKDVSQAIIKTDYFGEQ